MHYRVRDDRAASPRTGSFAAARRGALILTLPAVMMFASACNDSTAGDKPKTAATTTSGNGIVKLSADEILNRALTASRAATSVRLRGTVKDEGKSLTLDIRASKRGPAVGEMSRDGERFYVIRIGSTAYIKGDDAFWRSIGGADAVQTMSGKYLKVSANDKDFRDLTSMTLPSMIFGELLKPEGPVEKGNQETINGRPAIALTDGTDGAIYVATDGEPLVLRLKSGTDVLDFLSYNEEIIVHAPPAARVVAVPAK